MTAMETTVIVRYCETDQMGIVHHSTHPIWFEIGRTSLFDATGMRYSAIEDAGVILPLVDLHCVYHSPARFEERITIRTMLAKMSVVRMVFQYEIIHAPDGRRIATGETSHAWTDKQLQPVNLAKVLPDLYINLKKTMNSQCTEEKRP